MNNVQDVQENNLVVLAQKIKYECKSRNIAVSTLLKECELSKSFIYDIEKRNISPSIDKILKIAGYLNCSIDYLLGYEQNNKISVKIGDINVNQSPKANVSGHKITSQPSAIDDEIIEEVQSILSTLNLSEKADFIKTMYQFKKGA